MPRRLDHLDGVTAYPLCWPSNQERRSKQMRCSFVIQPSDVQDELHSELHRWQVDGYVVSMNLLPDNIEHRSDDPGAAVWFFAPSQDLVAFSCDAFAFAWQNLRAITLTLCRLRKMEEYGCFGRKQVMQGALALPCYAVEPKPKGWLRRLRRFA